MPAFASLSLAAVIKEVKVEVPVIQEVRVEVPVVVTVPVPVPQPVTKEVIKPVHVEKVHRGARVLVFHVCSERPRCSHVSRLAYMYIQTVVQEVIHERWKALEIEKIVEVPIIQKEIVTVELLREKVVEMRDVHEVIKEVPVETVRETTITREEIKEVAKPIPITRTRRREKSLQPSGPTHETPL